MYKKKYFIFIGLFLTIVITYYFATSSYDILVNGNKVHDIFVVDFGKITNDDIKEIHIHLKNGCDEKLKIHTSSSSCGCTTLKWDKDIVDSGDNVGLTFTFNPIGKKGQQSQTIDLHFMNTDIKPITFACKANIARVIEVNPNKLEFIGNEDEEITNGFTFAKLKKDNFTIKNMSVPKGYYTSCTIGDTFKKGDSLFITRGGRDEYGRATSKSTFVLKGREDKEIKVPLISMEKRKFHISPSLVYVRPTKEINRIESNIKIVRHVDFKSIDIRCDIDGIDIARGDKYHTSDETICEVFKIIFDLNKIVENINSNLYIYTNSVHETVNLYLIYEEI